MNGFGDNPFDDGLDFIGCPPRPTDLILPKFPLKFRQDCKLIRLGRCMPTADGQRRMRVFVENFSPDPGRCGVYTAIVRFEDIITGDVWYKGELKFYYTRNYLYTGTTAYEKRRNSILFRFVAKGDIVRVSDKMPDRYSLILCTNREDAEKAGVRSYDEIFVYGGLEIRFDVETKEMKGFMLSLGHNDGWYTHHPKCSARPIDWNGIGDLIGHYCDRIWLFVSPGRNFVFDPGIRPPTGRFFEEALRRVEKPCFTEEAIKYGEFNLAQKQCIHWYQRLRGWTACNTPFTSEEFCQGLVGTGRRFPWITFFSMGYWMDRRQRRNHILHLVEGKIKLHKDEFEEFKRGFYFYGFATQHERGELKLVDLASNKDVIGVPVDSSHLLYLYNAGRLVRDPKVRFPLPIDPRLTEKLLREEIKKSKNKDICSFLEDHKE